MEYSEKVLEHFAHPHNVGKIEDADGIGEVGNAKCGDIMKMYINGKAVESSDGQVIDVFAPATGERIDTVPKATAEDIKEAIKAAQEGKILVFAPESPLLERQFYLLYRRSSPLSPAAAMLVEELLYFYRDKM